MWTSALGQLNVQGANSRAICRSLHRGSSNAAFPFRTGARSTWVRRAYFASHPYLGELGLRVYFSRAGTHVMTVSSRRERFDSCRRTQGARTSAHGKGLPRIGHDIDTNDVPYENRPGLRLISGTRAASSARKRARSQSAKGPATRRLVSACEGSPRRLMFNARLCASDGVTVGYVRGGPASYGIPWAAP